MDKSITKKILFLYPYSYWPANPNCVSLIERCESEGFPFDLFCPSLQNCRGSGKEIGEWVWLVRRIFLSALKQSFSRPWKIWSIWKSIFYFFDLKHRIKIGEYSLIVTCDASGLGLLNRLKFRGNTPLIYLSYHILFRNELRTQNEKMLAQKEILMVPLVSLALSQDNNRKNLIAKELKLSPDKIRCVAVAPEPRFSQLKSSFKANNSKMILYCGNIEKWNIEELLDVIAEGIPANFYFRIHTHFKPPKSLHKRLLKLHERQLIQFTFSFLSEKELVHLIDSSYIGLAPYFPKNDSWMVNQTLYHIGKASTKTAYYCMRKKPVIVTPLPSLTSALDQYPFGRAISDWSTIAQTILEIDSNYEDFSNAAWNYYQNELCPTERLNLFWKELINLVPSSAT